MSESSDFWLQPKRDQRFHIEDHRSDGQLKVPPGRPFGVNSGPIFRRNRRLRPAVCQCLPLRVPDQALDMPSCGLCTHGAASPDPSVPAWAAGQICPLSAVRAGLTVCR